VSDFPPRFVALGGESGNLGLKRDKITKINAGNDGAFRKAIRFVFVA